MSKCQEFNLYLRRRCGRRVVTARWAMKVVRRSGQAKLVRYEIQLCKKCAAGRDAYDQAQTTPLLAEHGN